MTVRTKVMSVVFAVLLANDVLITKHEIDAAQQPIPLAMVGAPVSEVSNNRLVSVPKPKVCSSNPQCRVLAEAVFFEGRGESLKGQYAIAYTVINRRDSGKYSDTIKGVVNQKRRGICQFSYVCQIKPWNRTAAIKGDDKSWQTALDVAYNTLNYKVSDPTNGADHYHTKAVAPVWRKKLKKILVVGNHIFYRSNEYGESSNYWAQGS